MGRGWAQRVTTDSTFPPKGLYLKDAETMARTMATPEVSPGGLGAAIRMVTFYINRAGKNLSEERKAELRKAVDLLREWRRNTPTPLERREPGEYTHITLGPVTVEKRGRTWYMRPHRRPHPAIVLGPDGWAYLERSVKR